MEFFCLPLNSGVKITVTPEIDAQGTVTFDIHHAPKININTPPEITAKYNFEAKELEISIVSRGGAIAPRQRFLQRMLEHLIDVQGLDITCVSYESLTNVKATDLLVPLYKNATENQELIGSEVDPEALIAVPMVSALITLGFKELHIVPRSGPKGGLIGLEGVRSNDLSLRKIPIKLRPQSQQPSWSHEDSLRFNAMLSKNDGQ